MDGTQFDNVKLIGQVTKEVESRRKQESTTCPDINTFAGYLDEKLVGEEKKGVEAHMAQCGHCRNDFYEIRMLMDEQLPEVPEQLSETVKKNLKTQDGVPAQGRKIKV